MSVHSIFNDNYYGQIDGIAIGSFLNQNELDNRLNFFDISLSRRVEGLVKQNRAYEGLLSLPLHTLL